MQLHNETDKSASEVKSSTRNIASPVITKFCDRNYLKNSTSAVIAITLISIIYDEKNLFLP